MIEEIILSNIIKNVEYARRVISYIDKDYFPENGQKVLFALINDHFLKYNNLPTKEILKIALNDKKLKEEVYNQAVSIIDKIGDISNDINWLVDATENWCKKRAFYNAILYSADLLEQDDTSVYNGALDKVTKAISVSFDSSLGQDYFNDAEERFERYKEGYTHIPTGLYWFDKVTKGGFVRPSLVTFMAGTGVGKSLYMCNLAANFIRKGFNVVYFSMEMSELQIQERIDMNLLDLTSDELSKIVDKSTFMKGIEVLKNKMNGKLITKSYHSGQGHSGHFRFFIEELKQKKNIHPDVIIVDYLGICASARITRGTSNSNEYIGSVAIEIRGLAQEFNCLAITATQMNREGMKSNEGKLTELADGISVSFNSDYMYSIIETEDLSKQGQMIVKRTKDRYADYTSWHPSFIIGVDKTKQRIYDVNTPGDAGFDENFEW